MNGILKQIPFPQVTLPVFFLNLAIAVFYLFVRNYLPPEVPLLYGLPYGEDQLVKKDLLLIPLSISTVILILNCLLIKITKDNFSQKALLYLIIATSLLGIVTVVKIAFLVGGF